MRYRWTRNTVSITDCPGEGGMPLYYIFLDYDRETDVVTILLNHQDIGMHITMPHLKEQLAEWFRAIEEVIE